MPNNNPPCREDYETARTLWAEDKGVHAIVIALGKARGEGYQDGRSVGAEIGHVNGYSEGREEGRREERELLKDALMYLGSARRMLADTDINDTPWFDGLTRTITAIRSREETKQP